MSSESATSSQLHQQCSICLDPIDATIRSTARLACDHFFHLDCIGSEFNFRRMMQCPNCRLIEEGEWRFAAGGFQQSMATDDLDSENDEDMENDGDDDDDYFYVSPSTRMYLMQNRLPFAGVGLPPQGISNFRSMVPSSIRPAYDYAGTHAQHNFLAPQSQYAAVLNNSVSTTMANSQSRSHLLVAQTNVLDVQQSLGHAVHPNPVYVIDYNITNLQGRATVGHAQYHTGPVPMIQEWPGLFHSRVADQQLQRGIATHPAAPTTDAAGLHAAFFSRSNSVRPFDLNSSTSLGQASQPPPLYNAGNVRHSISQQAMGQRMHDRYQREHSTSGAEDDIVNSRPYRFF